MRISGISGFDWDRHNESKCEKHGVARSLIEAVFSHPFDLRPDRAHSEREERLLAVGDGGAERLILVVFTIRVIEEQRLIRPISARYMHLKEARRYEEADPPVRDR